MKAFTEKRFKNICEQVRREGYAVVGFVVKPESDAIMQINNQGMAPEQFVAFMEMALHVYRTSIPERNLVAEA
jgi:hypothetical protein